MQNTDRSYLWPGVPMTLVWLCVIWEPPEQARISR
jgi:hypothetical protein